MSEKVTDPWSYDLVLDSSRKELNSVRMQYSNSLTEQRKLRGGLKRARRIPGLRAGGLLADAEKDFSQVRLAVHALKTTIDSRLNEIEILGKAHPIWIGPATLDTLFNQNPESYRYIKSGKLPFDINFFSFAETFPIHLPFHSTESNLYGISLAKGETIGAPYEGYMMTFYSDADELISGDLTMVFTLDEPSIYHGSVSTKTDQRRFKIDMESKELGYIDVAKNNFEMPTEFDKVLPLCEVTNNDAFTQLPNLCVNLVNYINSHNVTVQRSSRSVVAYTGSAYNRQKKKKNKKTKKDYHLVIIKDGVVPEPEPSGETWTLEERIYVRGHDRRYRDEDGSIRKVTWIAPHIRGPPDAPWRNQRYQALGEKLFKEQEMMRKYVQDSS